MAKETGKYEYWREFSPGFIEIVDRISDAGELRPHGFKGIWDKPVIEEYRVRRTGELLHRHIHGYLMGSHWEDGQGNRLEYVEEPEYKKDCIPELLEDYCFTLCE